MSKQQDAWEEKLVQAQLDLGSYLDEALDDDGFGVQRSYYWVSKGMNMEDIPIAYQLAVKRTMEIRVVKGDVAACMRIINPIDESCMGSFVTSLVKGKWTKWEKAI